MAEPTIPNLIHATDAILEPPLEALAPANPRLVQLIEVASLSVQRHIHHTYTQAEVDAVLPKNLKLAVALTVAYLYERTALGRLADAERDHVKEKLGEYELETEYEYAKSGSGLAPVLTRLSVILSLLAPFITRTHPAVVLDRAEVTNWRLS